MFFPLILKLGEQKCEKSFIIIYISCEWLIFSKADLIKTNKNHMTPFFKKVKN